MFGGLDYQWIDFKAWGRQRTRVGSFNSGIASLFIKTVHHRIFLDYQTYFSESPTTTSVAATESTATATSIAPAEATATTTSVTTAESTTATAALEATTTGCFGLKSLLVEWLAVLGNLRLLHEEVLGSQLVWVGIELWKQCQLSLRVASNVATQGFTSICLN